MVCLVSFHVAVLLLLLHTSTQTDVEMKSPEDVKKQISLNGAWINSLVSMFTTGDSEIQSLRGKIIKADPEGMKNIDEYIICRSKYSSAHRFIKTWSTAQDLQLSYEKQFPDIKFDSLNFEAFFKENAERSKNMMSQYSIEKCNTLIPYRTADVILMDAHINMKYEFIEEFYIEFFKNEFLSKILEVKS